MTMYRLNSVPANVRALPILQSASGSIASFNTDLTENLVSCVCEVASGASEINVLLSNHSTVLVTDSKLNINSAGEVINVTQNFQCVIARVKQGETYTYSINGTIARSCPVIAFFTDYPKVGSVSYNGSRSVEEFATFTAPISGYVMVRGGNTYDEVNQMVATGTNVNYEQPTTYNIQFGETLSDDGSFDVLSGILTRSDDTTKQLNANYIQTNNGINNIYADTGDTSLNYWVTINKYIGA